MGAAPRCNNLSGIRSTKALTYAVTDYPEAYEPGQQSVDLCFAGREYQDRRSEEARPEEQQLALRGTLGLTPGYRLVALQACPEHGRDSRDCNSDEHSKARLLVNGHAPLSSFSEETKDCPEHEQVTRED